MGIFEEELPPKCYYKQDKRIRKIMYIYPGGDFLLNIEKCIWNKGEEFEEFQIGVEYESVLTEMKFRKWWNSELKPVLEYLKSYIDDKYNNHIHVTPSGNSEPPIGYEGNGSKMDSGTTANKITGSQTLKTL